LSVRVGGATDIRTDIENFANPIGITYNPKDVIQMIYTPPSTRVDETVSETAHQILNNRD
jgi:hypothetical protein